MKNNMKLFIILLALISTTTLAVDLHGFDVMPYCFDVTNGQFNLDGQVVDYATMQVWGPSNAVFVNGLNFGKTTKLQ